MVSFTIDPARDTPEALATYGKSFGADPDKWFFLTGAQKDLHHLCRNVFMLSDIDGSWNIVRGSSWWTAIQDPGILRQLGCRGDAETHG